MKTTRFISIAALVLAVSACSDKLASIEETPASTLKTYTISANMPSDATKSTVGEVSGSEAPFLWAEGDKISVFDMAIDTEAATNNEFTLSDGAGTSVGSFSGKATSLNVPLVIYPYHEANEYSDSDGLRVFLPQEYALENNTNAVLIGRDTSGETELNAELSHAGGVIAFNLTLPKGTKHVEIRADQQLYGFYTVDMDALKISIQEEYSGEEVWFTLEEALTEATDKVIYLPLACGTYTGLKIVVVDNYGYTIAASAASQEKEITQGKLLSVSPELTTPSSVSLSWVDNDSDLQSLAYGQTIDLSKYVSIYDSYDDYGYECNDEAVEFEIVDGPTISTGSSTNDKTENVSICSISGSELSIYFSGYTSNRLNGYQLMQNRTVTIRATYGSSLTAEKTVTIKAGHFIYDFGANGYGYDGSSKFSFYIPYQGASSTILAEGGSYITNANGYVRVAMYGTESNSVTTYRQDLYWGYNKDYISGFYLDVKNYPYLAFMMRPPYNDSSSSTNTTASMYYKIHAYESTSTSGSSKYDSGTTARVFNATANNWTDGSYISSKGFNNTDSTPQVFVTNLANDGYKLNSTTLTSWQGDSDYIDLYQLQLTMADWTLDSADSANYDLYWVGTFASIDDIKTFYEAYISATE